MGDAIAGKAKQNPELTPIGKEGRPPPEPRILHEGPRRTGRPGWPVKVSLSGAWAVTNCGLAEQRERGALSARGGIYGSGNRAANIGRVNAAW